MPTHENILNAKPQPPRGSSAAARFALSALVCTVFFALFFFFIPDVKTDFKKIAISPAYVSCEKPSQDFEGVAELADFAPMFIPTKWNVSANPPKPTHPDGWEIIAPQYSLGGANLLDKNFLTPEPDEIKKARFGLLNSVMRSAFSGYGRIASDGVENAPPATLELVDLRTGERVARIEIPQPELNSIISPARFDLTVERDGWIRRPLLRKTTGDDELDLKIAEMLTRKNFLKGVKNGSYKAIFTP